MAQIIAIKLVLICGFSTIFLHAVSANSRKVRAYESQVHNSCDLYLKRYLLYIRNTELLNLMKCLAHSSSLSLSRSLANLPPSLQPFLSLFSCLNTSAAAYARPLSYLHTCNRAKCRACYHVETIPDKSHCSKITFVRSAMCYEKVRNIRVHRVRS